MGEMFDCIDVFSLMKTLEVGRFAVDTAELPLHRKKVYWLIVHRPQGHHF